MIEAVIFDFDGTILDTESAEFHSWREVYEDHGCELCLAQFASVVGIGASEHTYDPYADLEVLVGRTLDSASIRVRRRARYAEMLDALEVLPGIERWLADARRLGFKVGLATSSVRAWVDRHLPRYGLTDHFDCIRTADDVSRTKPDPELYLSVLAGLGVQASAAITIEDSPNGIRAAKAAGVFTVAVPNPITACLSFDLADVRLASLDEMPLEELLERHHRR
jgi:HAD superfamily hydrolase (TIGR01509 family)